MTPQEPKGEQASADAGIMIAVRLLERAAVVHGSESSKGKAVREALHGLTKAYSLGEDQLLEIMPAEIKTALMAPAGDAGGGPQELSGASAPAAAAAAA